MSAQDEFTSLVDSINENRIEQARAILEAVMSNDTPATRLALISWQCKDLEALQLLLTMAIMSGNPDILALLLGYGLYSNDPNDRAPTAQVIFSPENILAAANKASIPVFEVMLAYG